MRLLIAALTAGATLLGTPLVSVAQEPAERSYATDHFTIEWVQDGTDAPDLSDLDRDGVPDPVEGMVAAFEAARAFVVEQLGYREPPGEDLYPLYVSEGDGRAYTRDLPGGSGRSKPSFIVIPPAYVRTGVSSDVMRAFAVHEYHHAVQLGYDSEEDDWITEATSTWIEDVFVDEADPNHRSLLAFLPFPNSSLLDEQGTHKYGAFLFLQFLMERFDGGDPTIVREIWEEMAVPQAIPGAPDRSSVPAVEEVLRRRDVTLEDAWTEFLLWRSRLRPFEEGSSYREVLKGTAWPSVSYRKRVVDETCRIEPLSGRLPTLAGDYAVFLPGRALVDETATLTVSGPARSAGYFLVKPTTGPAIEHRLRFDAAGVARVQLPFNAQSVRRVSMGAGHVEVSRPQPFAYSLRVDGKSDVTATVSVPSSTPYFNPISVTGTVICNGEPAASARVVVTETEAASGDQTVTVLTTDSEGRFRLSRNPEVNTVYSVAVDDPLLSQYRVPERLVAVKLFVILDVPDDAVTGLMARLRGAAEPAHPGGRVEVEFRRPSRSWRPGPSGAVGPDGAYAIDVTFPRDGVWEVRTRVIPEDGDHAEGVSPPAFVRLR